MVNVINCGCVDKNGGFVKEKENVINNDDNLLKIKFLVMAVLLVVKVVAVVVVVIYVVVEMMKGRDTQIIISKLQYI